MRKKKFLVLGGNGFIGKNICDFLALRGEEVYSFDMTFPKERIENIHYLQGDFFDDYTLKQMMKGMDVIYHAICTLNPGNSNEKYIMGYERDFVQTVKLCSWIEDSDCRLIYLSSGGTVYGNQVIQPIQENAVPLPINHYGNLKLCIENAMHIFNFQMNKNMIIARISNPYGPGQDYKKGVGFIDAALRHAQMSEPIEVWGEGKIIRDYIYIADVCRMLYSLAYYKGDIEVFNLSSNKGTSQNEVLRIVKELVVNINVEYFPERAVEVKSIILDNSRIMSVENFELIPIEEGIHRYYDYICMNIRV